MDAAKARYAAGLVSINDVTRAELEFATAEMGVTQVKGQVETTYLQLGYLLDDMIVSSTKLKVPEFLLQAAAEADQASIEGLVTQAQDRRLDLGALRYHAKAQHSQVAAHPEFQRPVQIYERSRADRAGDQLEPGSDPRLGRL
jgi:outer membrane protein TolC